MRTVEEFTFSSILDREHLDVRLCPDCTLSHIWFDSFYPNFYHYNAIKLNKCDWKTDYKIKKNSARRKPNKSIQTNINQRLLSDYSNRKTQK